MDSPKQPKGHPEDARGSKRKAKGDAFICIIRGGAYDTNKWEAKAPPGAPRGTQKHTNQTRKAPPGATFICIIRGEAYDTNKKVHVSPPKLPRGRPKGTQRAPEGANGRQKEWHLFEHNAPNTTMNLIP